MATATQADANLALQLYTSNVTRYNRLTSHPRNKEVANQLVALSNRMKREAGLVGQRFDLKKTLSIVRQFQQTSNLIASVEGRLGISTPVPPGKKESGGTSPAGTAAGKTWWKNPWVLGGAAAGVVVLGLLLRGRGGREE